MDARFNHLLEKILYCHIFFLRLLKEKITNTVSSPSAPNIIVLTYSISAPSFTHKNQKKASVINSSKRPDAKIKIFIGRFKRPILGGFGPRFMTSSSFGS